MSLSIPALFAAAVDADPAGHVDVGGGCRLAILDLDRRSKIAAGELVASEPHQRAQIRVTPVPGPQRAVELLAAWRVGLVVTPEPGPSAPTAEPAPEPAGAASAHTGTPAQRANLRQVAESRVWSETPAALTAAGTTLTHADLLGRLDLDVGPIAVVEQLLRYR